MKVDIDLSEVFEDEDGYRIRPEVKDLIINGAIDKIVKAADLQITKQLNDTLKSTIEKRVQLALDLTIEKLMDYEFVETSGYGATKTPITVRNRILNDVEKSMCLTNNRYDSDNNAYTRILKQTIESKLSAFAKEYTKAIDAAFIKECFEYAQKELQKKLGIK